MENNYTWELYEIENITNKEELDYHGYGFIKNEDMSLLNVIYKDTNICCIIPYNNSEMSLKTLRDDLLDFNSLKHTSDFINRKCMFSEPNTVYEFFKNNSDMNLIGTSMTGLDINKLPDNFKDLLKKNTFYVLFPDKDFIDVKINEQKQIQSNNMFEKMMKDDTIACYWDKIKPIDNEDYLNKVICIDTYSEFTLKSFITTEFLADLGCDKETSKYTYYQCFKNEDEFKAFLQVDDDILQAFYSSEVYVQPNFIDERSFEFLSSIQYQTDYTNEYTITIQPTKNSLAYIFS